MPIQNNIARKRNTTIQTSGSVFPAPNKQKPALGFQGTTYSSPFTESDKPPLGSSHNTATQVQLPATKMESPGVVVSLKSFMRVSPTEKGSTFATNVRPAYLRAVVSRAGGPSTHSDTPKNPNPKSNVTRPVVNPSVTNERKTTGSFLKNSNQTLSAHVNASTAVSRWATVKKGVVA